MMMTAMMIVMISSMISYVMHFIFIPFYTDYLLLYAEQMRKT